MKRRELQYEIDSEDRIRPALEWASEYIRKGLPAGAVVLFLGRPRRTLEQNAKLWPMLADIAKQVQWPDMETGELVSLTKEEWKDIFTAAWKRQKVVPGIDGGRVVIGAHTSTMTKRELAEVIEMIYEFGSRYEVKWSKPAKKIINERAAA